MPILRTDGERRELLERTSSVAIVGMSPNPRRASNVVATYLMGATDWTLWFVNPRESEILGRPVYPSLAALPRIPDIVDVFRRTDHLPHATHDAIRFGAPAIWFQLGLEHEDAAAAAAAAGMDVVQDKCLKTEHARVGGGLHAAGFGTGVNDSGRDPLV